MRKKIASIVGVIALAMMVAVPAYATGNENGNRINDGLAVESVVCDATTGQNIVTVRYTNNEDAGDQEWVNGHFEFNPFHYVPGHFEFVDENNDVDVVKVNGDELDPVVTAPDGGGSVLLSVTYAGIDTGDHWIILTVGWNKYADNFFAYDGPDNGHSPDFSTIKVKVDLEECVLVPEEPAVVLRAPRINTTGYCVQTLNRGWTYVEAAIGAFDAGQEWRALYDSGATVFVAGHDLKLAAEGDNGIVVAPIVNGIGGTCDQPYVSNATPPIVKTK